MTTDPRARGFETPNLAAAEAGGGAAEQTAYLELMRTAQTLGAAVGALTSAHGLSGKQYNALRAIRRGGAHGLSAGEIGAQMTDPGADVTRLVDRLEREGLAVREVDAADRRVVRTRLTAAGAAVLAQIDAPMLELHHRQLGHLSPSELETLATLLRAARAPRER